MGIESARDPSRDKSSGNRYVSDVLSILFILAVVSLISILFIPRFFDGKNSSEERPIDDIVEKEIIPNDPGEVIGPHNRHKFTTDRPVTPEEDSTEMPTSTIAEEDYTEVEPHPTKDPNERLPHPEESDEDDLSLLYKGLNPERSEKHRILYRLAEWIQPISYDVNLIIAVKGLNGIDTSSVVGNSTATFAVRGEPSNLLEIHGEFFHDLQFHSLQSISGQQSFKKPIRQFYNEEKRTYSFLLEQPLKDGETYTLILKWVGSIGRGTMGLYETWYYDGSVDRYSLSTQGEPMGTRKWMPCFDQPAIKATLTLKVFHPSSLTARSNGRIVSTEEEKNGRTTLTTFAPTQKISPYLYALSVTDYVEMKDTVEGIPISVVLPPTHSAHLNSSLQLAKNSTTAYLSALNATKIFEKMDFVFVPDHGSAMENVGHITFAISNYDKYRVYAHEMMHQYFGNLITLSWWDEVWINEGLTTVYEIDAVHGIGTKEAIKNYRDIRRNDMIKGGVVLLMIRNVVGEKAWKSGVETFLRKFEYQSVVGMDFLREIIQASSEQKNGGDNGQTPQLTMSMARSFLENRGFPLLRITRNGRTIEFTQERFHRGFINGNKKENKQKWFIPIHLIKLDGTHYKSFIMADRSLSIDVDFDEELILDPSKVVFYRTVYDKETYKRIMASSLPIADKNEIVDDLLHSAFSGYVEPRLAFSVYFMRNDKPSSDSLMNIYSKIGTVLPRRLSTFYRIHTGKNESEVAKWESTRFHTTKSEYCDGVKTVEDFVHKYRINRTYEALFCTRIIGIMGLENYTEMIEHGLNPLSKSRFFHPSDFERLLRIINDNFPNIVANTLVKMAGLIKDEFVFANVLFRVRNVLDARSTSQLRKIAEISLGAARQNAIMITQIFNERHAIETEDRILGDKLEEAFQKEFSEWKQKNRTKLSKSGVNTQKLLEIPEDPLGNLDFY